MLPRWALALLLARELITLLLAQLALLRGVEIEINWVGRIAVFLVLGGLFWALVLDSIVIDVIFVTGVILAALASVVYLRSGLRRAAPRAA